MIQAVLRQRDLESIIENYLSNKYSKTLDRDVKLKVDFIIDNGSISANVSEIIQGDTNEEKFD